MLFFTGKEKEQTLNEFLSECTEWHALMHGVWTGVKGVRWQSLPREARREIKKEWQYFELGQIIGWGLKIGMAIIVFKLEVGSIV